MKIKKNGLYKKSSPIVVWEMDFESLIPEITFRARQKSEMEKRLFRIDPSYAGSIFFNGKYIVINKNGGYFCLNLKDNMLTLPVFHIPTDPRVVVSKSDYTLHISVEDINACKTGKSFALSEFMGSNYQSNERIINNEQKLIEYLTQ